MKNRFAIGVVLLGVAMAGQAPAVGQSKGPVTLALTGDSIITQRLSPFKEPEFTGGQPITDLPSLVVVI